MGEGGQRNALGRFTSPGKTRYPSFRRQGGCQGRSGCARKISPPPGFDPRTVQPIASRYTDRAIPAPFLCQFHPNLLSGHEYDMPTDNALHHMSTDNTLHHMSTDNTLHHMSTDNTLHHMSTDNTLHHVNRQHAPQVHIID